MGKGRQGRWHQTAVAIGASLLVGAVQAQQTVILVRHAELAPPAAMAEPRQVPLSDAGEARAKLLASLFKDAGVDAIYATDFVRTSKTGEPLAQALGKEVIVVAKSDAQQMVERLRANHAGQTVLLVGHTDTIPGLIKALGHPVDIKIESTDYGNIFVLTPRGSGPPAFLRLRY